MPRNNLLASLAFLASPLTVAPQDGSCTYNGVDFSKLSNPAKVETPYGSLYVVGCGKLTSLPGGKTCADQEQNVGSACLETNFTDKNGKPETGRSPVLCGMTGTQNPDIVSPQYVTDLPDPQLMVGMIQGNGDRCGPFVPEDTRTSVTIAFECDKSAGVMGTVQFKDFKPPCNFNLTWQTELVCNLPPAPGRPDALRSSNFGTTFLLVFFLSLSGYCIVGTVIKSRLPNASANFYNNIPNKEFWFGLPGLVGEGCSFAASGGKRDRGDEYEQVETGSDDGPKE